MTDTAHAERAHARLSASGSSIWLNCQQSAVLSKELERRSSVWADEGTRAHEVAEMLIRGLAAPQDAPPEMVRGVEPYVRLVLTKILASDTYGIEQKLTLSPLWAPDRAPEAMFGTVDFWGASGRVLSVVDLKYGKYHVVEVVGSTQLRYYALAAYLALPASRQKSIDWVDMTIVQPRADHPAGPIRTWRIHVLDLLDWGYDVVRTTVDEIITEAPGLTLKEGPWCRWCPAQMDHCPLKLASKGERARDVFDELV